MNSLLSAIKAFVLKNRPAYKDYLGNGKYDVKKLPEECVPDSVNNKIRIAQRTANDAQSNANDAQSTANDAQSTATNALSTATGTATQINNVTTFVKVFASVESTKNKEKHQFTESMSLNGTSSLPFAEAKAPMKCYFDIMLNDSSNHNIKHYAAFEGKIVREVTKRSDTYCLFIDESVEVVNECFAKLKIGYKFSNDDNLWHKFIRAEVTLPDDDFNNTSITTIILNARGIIPNTYNYAPWPSICVPLAGTNDAGVVYASDKTDDQTVPVSIDKNGYLWCKGSETTVTVGTVTTGEPGTDAAVTNAGTSAAAVLNFVIPRGEKGETGTTGEAGYTPVKGVDYFTDAEKSEIIQAVLDTLPKDGNPGDILVKTETGSEWQYIPDVLKPIIIEAEVNMSNGTVNLTADGISKMNTLDSRYENGNPCPAYLHYALNGANVYTALIFSQLRNYYFRKDYTVSIYVAPDTKNGWILITEPKT